MAVNLLEPSFSGATTSGSSSSSFIWKYCRMCALEVRQGVYIFGEEGRRLQLPEKIRKTLAILVLEEDSLPKKICTSCCTSLEAYTQFKDTVADAQDKLSSIAKSIEKSQEQGFLQLRNKQFHRSPKRPKFSTSAVSHSSSHVVIPLAAPSVDLEIGDPAIAIECDDFPASAECSEDEEITDHSKSQAQIHPECHVPLESEPAQGTGKNEELNHQEPLPGPSHSSICLVKQPTTETYGDVQPGPLDISKNGSFCDNSPTCSDNNKEEDSDNEHISSPNYLICGLCTAPMSDKNMLVAHHNKMHFSQEEPTYGCSKCPRITSNYEAIRQHIYRHKMFMSGAFKCPDCDISFPAKEQLHMHISSKHNPSGIKAFSCQTCGKKYSSDTALNAHKRKAHSTPHESSNLTSPIDRNNGTEKDKPIASSGIGIEPHNLSEDDRKDPTAMEKSSLLGCSPEKYIRCSTVAATESTLDFSKPISGSSSHNTESSVSIKEPSNSEGKNSSSDTSSKEKLELGGHWKCGYCDKILYTKHGYDSHIAVHKGRRFTCEHCNATYTQKFTLEHHVKVHHTNIDKEFECSECKKKFKTFRQLAWHKKTHEKPLTDVTCPQCEKKFLNMISLKTHMKLHRGSKKFPCLECPKTFFTKLKLQEHMNSHTGKRPYGCPAEHCSKVFSCFSNYSKHFKKHHKEQVGPKGSMVPHPNMSEEDNNNIPTAKPIHKEKADCMVLDKSPLVKVGSTSTTSTHSGIGMEKEVHTAAVNNANSIQGKSQEQSHHQSQTGLIETSQSNISHINTVIHVPYSPNTLPTTISHIPVSHVIKPVQTASGAYSTNPNSTAANILHPPVTINSSVVNSIAHMNNPFIVSNNNNNTTGQGGGQCHVVTIHSSPHQNISSSDGNGNNLNMAHVQPPSSSAGTSQNHHQGGIHGGNAAHANTHNTTSTHTQTVGVQSQLHHPVNQFQLQNQAQSVWQPVILPNTKTYNNPSSVPGLPTLNGLDLLDCGTGTIVSAHSSESLTSSNNHAHGQHQSNFNVIHVPVTSGHHATPMSHSHPTSSHNMHHHHGTSIPSSNNVAHQSVHPGNSNHHNSNNSTPIHVPTPSAHNNSSSNSIALSSAGTTVNVPNFVPSNQQSEPMKLSYKMDSNNFQDMPMELTKVFQRDPLELCVRHEFSPAAAAAQPLMDLSSRVVNVTVGGNQSMNNVSSISMNLNGGSSSGSQNHYGSSGTTNTTTVLSVPYHKTELVERELTLNDFTGAFRQPIDLIARTDEQSHELCTEGNLVDLSLRSSFGQDQTASSFLRELIDLSSRSDSFHGEINLTNKQHQSSSSASNSNSQLHHHTHSSTGQLISATKPSNPPNSHHNHGHHHHHHHVQTPSHHHQHQPSNNSSGVGLQTVIYPDAIFGLQN